MKRKLQVLAMICILLFKFILLPNDDYNFYVLAAEKDKPNTVSQLSEKIPVNATKYVKANFDNIIEIAKDLSEELNIDSGELDSVLLSTPFIIYDIDSKEKQEEFYYPVINTASKDVIMVINVLGTTAGWQHSFSTELVNELNNISWPKKDCIFLRSNGKVMIKTTDSSISPRDLVIKTTESEFELNSEEIVDSVEEMEKIKVEENKQSKESPLLEYTPTVTNELGYYYCNLENAQGQEFEPICWAAAVATVVNYVFGSNVTAKRVCDAIGHSYDGGYYYDMKSALLKYGLRYVYRNRDLYFKTVVANIQQKKPLILIGSGHDSNGKPEGHAVTIYGYRDLSGTDDYLIIWDSNILNSEYENVGGVRVVSYKEKATTFMSANIDFTWVESLSYK